MVNETICTFLTQTVKRNELINVKTYKHIQIVDYTKIKSPTPHIK